MYAHTRHALTCSVPVHTTRSPCDALSHACPHVQMHSHTYTHLPSHSCAHPHTHTGIWTHGHTRMCFPKMPTHIHTQKKPCRVPRNTPRPVPSHTQSHPWPPPKHTHTQLKNIDTQRSTLGLARGQPPRDTMHKEKNAQGATRVHTPGWTHTQTHGHTHTKSQPPALTPPRSPNRRQALALTPGRTVQTQRRCCPPSPGLAAKPTLRACQAAPPANKKRMCKNKTERLR